MLLRWIVVPAILTAVGWLPATAHYFKWFEVKEFFKQYQTLAWIGTVVAIPILCLVYDTYRAASLQIRVRLTVFLIVGILLLNFLLLFFTQWLFYIISHDSASTAEALRRLKSNVESYHAQSGDNG